MTTLEQAQRFVLQQRDAGVRCPCCGQYAKTYRRRINGSMAMALIMIDRYYRCHDRCQWLHVEEYLKRMQGIGPSLRGDFPKLRYWDLIEAKRDVREDGSKRVGLYRITPMGIRFVANEITVLSPVIIYNEGVMGFGDRKVSILDALGTRFDYNELMGLADRPL